MAQPKISGAREGKPRMIFGSDGSDHYEGWIDSSGRVHTFVESLPGQNALTNIFFAYNAAYHEAVEDPNADAGANTLFGSAVPAGEVWVVHNIVVFDLNNATSLTSMGCYHGATYYSLKRVAATVARVGVSWQGELVLEAGDTVYGYLDGCTLNDNIYLQINGYKMKVA